MGLSRVGPPRTIGLIGHSFPIGCEARWLCGVQRSPTCLLRSGLAAAAEFAKQQGGFAKPPRLGALRGRDSDFAPFSTNIYRVTWIVGRGQPLGVYI
jgi:hypothetical protein